MRTSGTRRWPSTLSTILLLLASPLFFVVGWTVLVTWPREVADGVVQVFSGHDVVQVAGAKETGVTLFLPLLALWGACWLLRLRLPFNVAFWMAALGFFLWPLVVTALGLGAEYGLQAVLAARGYGYCTFHVTDTGKGSSGTYVYVRDGLPGGCDAARAAFPPGKLVPDRREAFDLPPR